MHWPTQSPGVVAANVKATSLRLSMLVRMTARGTRLKGVSCEEYAGAPRNGRRDQAQHKTGQQTTYSSSLFDLTALARSPRTGPALEPVRPGGPEPRSSRPHCPAPTAERAAFRPRSQPMRRRPSQ